MTRGVIGIYILQVVVVFTTYNPQVGYMQYIDT